MSLARARNRADCQDCFSYPLRLSAVLIREIALSPQGAKERNPMLPAWLLRRLAIGPSAGVLCAQCVGVEGVACPSSFSVRIHATSGHEVEPPGSFDADNAFSIVMPARRTQATV